MIQDFRAIWWWGGRAPRRQYWLAVAVATVATAVGVGLALSLALAEAQVLGFALCLVLLLIGVIPLAMTTMRRLQDRDRRPTWIGLIVAPGLLGDLADWLGWSGSAQAVVFIVGAAIWGLCIVELGFLPGTSGRNRFGDDPLQPSQAEAFS